MELKEILAYGRKWWWLVALAMIIGFVGSFYGFRYFGHKSAPEYRTTAMLELPRDPDRRVSFRGAAFSRRIVLDQNTELEMLQSDGNLQSAVRYFTLLRTAVEGLETKMTATLEDAALTDLDREIFEIQRDYRDIRARLDDLAVRPNLPSQLDYYPEEYWPEALKKEKARIFHAPDVSPDARVQQMLSAMVDPNLRAQLNRISIVIKPRGTSRLVDVTVTLTGSGAEHESRNARLWTDAILLAAKRQSYQRLLRDFESIIETEHERLQATALGLSDERKAELDAAVAEIHFAIQGRNEQMRNFLEGRSEDKPNRSMIDPPRFSPEEQAKEELYYYRRLRSDIEGRNSALAVDVQTKAPVGRLLAERLALAQSRYNEADGQAIATRRRLESLRFQRSRTGDEEKRFVALRDAQRPEDYIPNAALVSSADMSKARSELDTLIREREDLAQRYTALKTEMLENTLKTTSAIGRWVDSVVAAFKAQYQRFDQEEEGLTRELNDWQNQAENARKDLISLRIEQNEENAYAGLYASAYNRVNQLAAMDGGVYDYKTELERARNEQSPVMQVFSYSGTAVGRIPAAKEFQVASVVSIVIFVGSIVLLYVVMLARNKIATEYDVRRHINLPVLAKLARRPVGERSLLEISPRSASAEAFSTLATLIRSYAKELSLHSILVTSAIKEEGKTDIVCNLGIALVRKGLRVLIVDTDLHRSRVRHFFNMSMTPGILHYCEDGSTLKLRDVVTNTVAEGLDILQPGGDVADPVRLLESEQFRKLMKEAEGEYDLVIYDSPPVARVGDALILASEVDATIFVVSSGAVTFADATLSKRLLTNVQANLLGVILNNTKDARAREYYNYYGYGDRSRRRVRSVVD